MLVLFYISWEFELNPRLWQKDIFTVKGSTFSHRFFFYLFNKALLLYKHPLEIWVCLFLDNGLPQISNNLFYIYWDMKAYLHCSQCSLYLEFFTVTRMQICFLSLTFLPLVLQISQNLCFLVAWNVSDTKTIAATANCVCYQSHLPLQCIGSDRFGPLKYVK